MDNQLTSEFKNSVGNITRMYKEAKRVREQAYNSGRTSAAKEILEMCARMKNEDRKYVNMEIFISELALHCPEMKVTRVPDCPKRLWNQ